MGMRSLLDLIPGDMRNVPGYIITAGLVILVLALAVFDGVSYLKYLGFL